MSVPPHNGLIQSRMSDYRAIFGPMVNCTTMTIALAHQHGALLGQAVVENYFSLIFIKSLDLL